MPEIHQIEAYQALGDSFNIYKQKRNFITVLKNLNCWNDAIENYLETVKWNRDTLALESPYPSDNWIMVYVKGNAIKVMPYLHFWTPDTYNEELVCNFLEFGLKIESSSLSTYHTTGYTEYESGMQDSLLHVMKTISKSFGAALIYLTDEVTEGTAFQHVVDPKFEGTWDFDLAIIPKIALQYQSEGHRTLKRLNHFYYISSNSNVVWTK